MVCPSSIEELRLGATASWSPTEMSCAFSTSPTESSKVRTVSVLPSTDRVTVLLIEA
jgi:hypothetical protein